MKSTIKLDNFDTSSSNIWCNLILTIEHKSGYSDYLTVKLRAGGINIRIMSDHLVNEMKVIIKFLDKDTEIQSFAKELLDAKGILNKTITL